MRGAGGCTTKVELAWFSGGWACGGRAVGVNGRVGFCSSCTRYKHHRHRRREASLIFATGG